MDAVTSAGSDQGFRPQRIRDFAGAIAYQNPTFVGRYARRAGLPIETALHHFSELKKFLIVCGMLPASCSPSHALDEIWHQFILHTRAYQDYCETYIGRFLHHNPTEQPYLGSRRAMIQLALDSFGSIDTDLWPKMEIVNCSSACSGDNYCSEG